MRKKKLILVANTKGIFVFEKDGEKKEQIWKFPAETSFKNFLEDLETLKLKMGLHVDKRLLKRVLERSDKRLLLTKGGKSEIGVKKMARRRKKRRKKKRR